MSKKSARRTGWSLYIDESGDFDKSTESVLLAAVLVADTNSPLFAARLKQAIEQAAPLIPWPFHRWLATKPVMHALWWNLADETRKNHRNVPPYLTNAAGQAIELWQQNCPGLLNKVLKNLQQGIEPTRGQIDELYKDIKRIHRELLEPLKIYSDHVCAAVSQSLYLLASADDTIGGAFSFLTAEDSPGSALEPEGNRYFTLLSALLERAFDAISQLPGEHTITVHLASRFAEHPDLPTQVGPGKKYRLSLTSAHIRDACQRVLDAAPSTSRTIPRVRFSTGKVHKYNAQVPPSLVLADTAANLFFSSLRRWPKKKHQGLERFHIPARHTLRLPLKIHTNSPSHVSAPGPAQLLIQQARNVSGKKSLSFNSIQSPWALEQAEQWIEFFETTGEEVH